MPLRPGETFGRYQLAELLGRGGMGEVYSAYDSVLHRKVALKVLTVRPDALRDGRTPSTDGPARILREARAAAGITHPNAVAIYDVGEVDGVPFLAMELVAGRTLRSFVGDTSIPLTRRIRWITDVARALGAAHQLGLVHRDIKPENVMVRDDGFAKVLDFGIARRAIAKGDARPPTNPTDLAALAKFAMTNGTLTAEGVVMGTPMYMAPEQIRAEAIDGRTDQFAWGVLAVEVLTGRTPWEGEGIAIFSQILSREVDPVTKLAPEVPARVDAVVRRALSKLPDARFRTMEEIADELEAFATAAGGGTGGNRISIPVREMTHAATEQISVTEQNAAVKSGWPAATQGSAATGGVRRGRAAIAVVAVAIVLAGVLGVRARSSARVAPATVVDAADGADVPSQMSSNPDANAAYRAGMQAVRDGSPEPAMRQFTRATELDPLFGSAQLRLVLAGLLSIDIQTVTSADLQRAHASQASLGTHDRILLEAFELVARDPPDYVEAQRRLEAAMQRYPADGDLPFYLGLLLDYASQPTLAIKALDASIARDPSFASAWRLKSDVLIELDDAPAANEAFAECLKISPSATGCLSDLTTLQANEGKCGDLVATARRVIALVPKNLGGYAALAMGLAGGGESDDAVRVALKQLLDHAPAPERSLSSKSEAALSVLRGDLLGAERQYAELDRLPETEDFLKYKVAYPRVLLDLELGRSAAGIRAAEGYLRQRAALSSNEFDGLAIAMQAAERTAGGLSREAFVASRDQWLVRNQDGNPVRRWIEAYARPAETREDATAALTAMPDVHPLLNLFDVRPFLAEPIGRVFVLAGQPDSGVPYLREASSSCDVLDGQNAIYSTQAAFELGSALEGRGDSAGACAAYQRVLARWGTATHEPRTASNARKRKRALGCAP